VTAEEKNISSSIPTPYAYIWKASHERANQPMDDGFVLKVLGGTIKHDIVNKWITFHGQILNYTEEDQQNLMFSAPSSTGKSWIALEIAKFFPKEDVDKKGYVSKRAFFHRNSQLQTLDGKPLEKRSEYITKLLEEWEDTHSRPDAPDFSDKSREAINARKTLARWKEERKAEYRKHRDWWDSAEKVYVLDLSKRIIIFKDTPDDQVLQPLRSLLSHDEKELIVEITDKSASGGNLTKRVKLIGYPTVVFLTAAFSPDEQERTRVWLLSPDMSQDKLRDSLDLQAESLRDRAAYRNSLEVDIDRKALMCRIEMVKGAKIAQINIRPLDMEDLKAWFKGKGRRGFAPRDMRDFPRLVSMVKGHALFNLPQRESSENGELYAQKEDIDVVKERLGGVIEANRLGLPPYIYDWWKDTLRQLLKDCGDMGLSLGDFSKGYCRRFNTLLSNRSRKQIIGALGESGLLEERTDPDDRRTTKLYVQGVGIEDEKNIYQPEDPKKVEFVGEVLRERPWMTSEEMARALGVPVEEAENLLEALWRDNPGYVSRAPGGRWGWSE